MVEFLAADRVGLRPCERARTITFRRRLGMSRRQLMILAAAAASGLAAGSARAALVAEWKGDTYTTGNWVDSTTNGHDATPVGSVTTTPNAFNGHAGVNFAGGNGAAASGFFTVTNNASTLI